MTELLRFSAQEIYISQHEAWTILEFFWPNNGLHEAELANNDIAFAQGLFVEAIDASYKMGYVHIIFDTFYGKIPGSFTDIEKLIKTFVKKAVKYWFQHLGQKNLSDAQIYVAVKHVISLNFRSVIQIRQQTGELIY